MKRKAAIAGVIFLTGWLVWWTQPHIDQGGTVKIWDRNNTLLYESAGNIGRKIPVPFDRLPKYLTDAAVAAEDNTFWTNPGVDFPAIARSMYLNLQAGKIVSGASTITQQLSRSSGNRIVRKVREILTALRLAKSYDKKTLLTMYLNQMYFGNLAYGAQAAALTYFDKDVSHLSLAQSALLAGLISSPDYYNPLVYPERARLRQSEVLDLMQKNSLITGEQTETAKAEKLTYASAGDQIKAPHFVSFVRKELEKTGIDISKTGINIQTTLDYPDLSMAQDIASMWVKNLSPDHDLSNAALVMLENQTGAIRVMLGGIDYFDATHAGQVNLTTSARQPGSALKPITYSAAFAEGFTPATLIYDVQTVYKTKKGEGFAPNNYDGKYHGLVLAREALASSLNQPAVEMLSRIGIDKFLHTARALGITTLGPDPRYDLALTLGGGEVTLLDLTNVYASLARGGNFLPPYPIEKITDDKGQVLYQHQAQRGKPVWGDKSAQIAFLITDILSDPRARILGFGEKNPLVLPFPAAAKTGTTTDWHDNWTVGYTPDFSLGVWVGNNDNHPMTQLTGITGAAPIWNQFFAEFAKGRPVKNFSRPPGLVEAEICRTDGLLPDALCPERQTEIFMAGTQPITVSRIYKQVKIDIRNGLLAADDCPEKFVSQKILADYPPPVYRWAAENGLGVIPRETSPLCRGVTSSQTDQVTLSIINPLPNAVFQSAPAMVKNQAVDLTVTAGADIRRVDWYVDDNLYQTSKTYPFSGSWPPIIGSHIIRAVGTTTGGQTVTAETVTIKVTIY